MNEFWVCVRWSGERYGVSLPVHSTVFNLKELISERTGVPCHRQRQFGLIGPRGTLAAPVDDETKLSEVKIKSGNTIMMIGSNEPLFEAPKLDSGNQATQECVLSQGEDKLHIPDENYKKIESRIKKYKFEQLTEPRKGKKLLVLDVDCTLLKCGACVESILESTRPHLHEFLAVVYPYYDIFIWSATSLKAIKLKMQMMEVLSNDRYKICALMDHRAMITVYDPKYGVFESKPLQLIWSRYADSYGPHNTIMIDDMKRNFITSPQNGLKISAFRSGSADRDVDVELIMLKGYMLAIAKLNDFTHLNHSKWKEYLDVE